MGARDPIYIYADNAATTPLSPRALSAMMPYLTESFGNPGGIHRIAAEAADALRRARTSMANLLGASSPAEIYYTSGGTESDNWILRGRCSAFQHLYGDAAPVRIITSQSSTMRFFIHAAHLNARELRQPIYQSIRKGS